MPETFENWLRLSNSGVYYAHQNRAIYQVLPYSVELWNPLSKIVIGKCSFIWNKRPVNIWTYRKAQNVGPVNIFQIFTLL